jgi:hypothetical protein
MQAVVKHLLINDVKEQEDERQLLLNESEELVKIFAAILRKLGEV